MAKPRARVLIVEDYEDTVSILKRLLKREGFAVEAALTKAEAREKFARFRPELVVLDLSLPDGNGLDLAPEFKREDPEVEIIVLTAYAELENAIRSVRKGVSDFIPKPFDSRYLLHALNRCLEMRRLREALARSEKLRVLGEMAAGVAHDFNNILFALRVLFSGLKSRVPASLREEVEKGEKMLLDAQGVVERLRRFYRKEAVKIVPFPLEIIVEEVVRLTEAKWGHQPLQEGRRIIVSLNLEGETQVQGNPSDLREVLTNLIFNAVEAMPQGGEIRIATYAEDGFGVVRVEDTGCGIPPEIGDRIFEPFFTTKEEGTGLGLAVCHRLLKTQGGELSFESTPGQGSVFYVRLPLAER